MYFQGVNRGMAFTKAGFYLTGLAFLAGLLATGSGSNALFLVLGLGLSALVVSGILSEKVMRHAEVVSIDSVQVSADTPFSIPVHIRNSNEAAALYAVEIFINRHKPRYRLLPKDWSAEFYGNVLKVAAGNSASFGVRSAGLERGRLQKVFLTQATLFPFNLVRKYKVDAVATDILILPKLDLEFLQQLDRELTVRAQAATPSQEFFSHRLLHAGDNHRNVDWKRSTTSQVESWVLKVFQQNTPNFGIEIVPQWSELASLSPHDCERFLSRIYTAWEYCKRQNRLCQVQVGAGKYSDNAPEMLAAFPKGASEHPPFLSALKSHSLPKGIFITLEISSSRHGWVTKRGEAA